jgi:hypothetical protein
MKKNSNTHSHPQASADHGFGYERIFFVCSIHPSARLHMDWVYSDLGGGGGVAWVEEGHKTLLCRIPLRAGLSRDQLYTWIPCPSHANRTVQIMGLVGLAARQPQWSGTGMLHYFQLFRKKLTLNLMTMIIVEFCICTCELDVWL